MEIYGATDWHLAELWKSMEIYGDLWQSMGIYGDLWQDHNQRGLKFIDDDDCGIGEPKGSPRKRKVNFQRED